MEKKLVNYDEAQKEINEYENELTPFWKANIGQHLVKFLSEMEYWNYENKDTGEIEKRVKIEIEVNKEKFAWAMGIGKTPASAYGQLTEIGKKYKELTGKTVVVYIKNNGKRNDYTIIDSNNADESLPEDKIEKVKKMVDDEKDKENDEEKEDEE